MVDVDWPSAVMAIGLAVIVVVAAAAAGDFSQRVAASFADDELNALADSVNTLLETVQSGLSETCAVLAELSAGHLSTRVEGLYQGAFAELQQNVNATLATLKGTMREVRETSRWAAVTNARNGVRHKTRRMLPVDVSSSGVSLQQRSVAMDPAVPTAYNAVRDTTHVIPRGLKVCAASKYEISSSSNKDHVSAPYGICTVRICTGR